MQDWLKHRIVQAAIPFRRRIAVTARMNGNRFDMDMGDRTYFLEADRDLPKPEVYDFAAWMIAALAMRRGVPVRFDMPVSQGTAMAIGRTAALWTFRFPKVTYPLDLQLTNIVPNPIPSETGGILCLSGGIDSTQAAIEAKNTLGYSHAMMMHGMDFNLKNTEGFSGRHGRVKDIANHFGLDLIVVRTNMSRSLHGLIGFYALQLLVCLRFAGCNLPRGGFAADQTTAEALLAVENSNIPGVEGFMSADAFCIDHIGGALNRAAKLKEIKCEEPELLPKLGFCLEDQLSGGNCGICEKCMRVRWSLEQADIGQREIFSDEKDWLSHYEENFRKTPQMNLLTLHRLENALAQTPRGERRVRMIRLAEKYRARVTTHRAPKIAMRDGN